MARLEILDPTVEPRKQPLTYVARPDSLQGKRIGLIENTKFNSDRLLLRIGEILKQDYGAAEISRRSSERLSGSAAGPGPESKPPPRMFEDAPPCSTCGSIMIRNGSCYKCLNCGSTSGCS